jgi:AraC-like DNA-binding protein
MISYRPACAPKLRSQYQVPMSQLTKSDLSNKARKRTWVVKSPIPGEAIRISRTLYPRRKSDYQACIPTAYPVIILVERGVYQAGTKLAKHVLSRGDMQIIPPGLQHALGPLLGSDAIVWGIEIRPDIWHTLERIAPESIPQRRADLPPSIQLTEIELGETISLLKHLRTASGPLETLIWIAGVIKRQRDSKPTPFGNSTEIELHPLVRAGIDGLRAHGWRGGLACAAQCAGVTADHLTRLARKHHGVSAHALIQRIRVGQAHRQLLFSNQSIGKIAEDAGFTALAHFCRIYRALVGETPGVTRRSIRYASP